MSSQQMHDIHGEFLVFIEYFNTKFSIPVFPPDGQPSNQFTGSRGRVTCRWQEKYYWYKIYKEEKPSTNILWFL